MAKVLSVAEAYIQRKEFALFLDDGKSLKA